MFTVFVSQGDVNFFKNFKISDLFPLQGKFKADNH